MTHNLIHCLRQGPNSWLTARSDKVRVAGDGRTSAESARAVPSWPPRLLISWCEAARAVSSCPCRLVMSPCNCFSACAALHCRPCNSCWSTEASACMAVACIVISNLTLRIIRVLRYDKTTHGISNPSSRWLALKLHHMDPDCSSESQNACFYSETSFPYTGFRNSKMSGDSTNAFLHCGDDLGH